MKGLHYEISFIYHGANVENTARSGLDVDSTQGFVSRLLTRFGDATQCLIHLCYLDKRLFTIGAKEFLDIIDSVEEGMEDYDGCLH